MDYEILVTPQAQRQLNRLAANVRATLESAIDRLASNPRPHGVQKLAGGENEYRIREGNYRVVYEIRDKMLVVVVVRVGHRRDIYR